MSITSFCPFRHDIITAVCSVAYFKNLWGHCGKERCLEKVWIPEPGESKHEIYGTYFYE